MKNFKARQVNFWWLLLLSVVLLGGCSAESGDGNRISASVTSPKVIHTVNPDGATNVFMNTKIIATFSKLMGPATITAANFTFMQGSTPVPGKVTYLGLSLVFTPTILLAANTPLYRHHYHRSQGPGRQCGATT